MISKIKTYLVDELPLIAHILQSMRSMYRQFRSRLYIKQLLKSKKEIFIEVGSGDKKGKDGWKTVDITDNCDIYWDLRKGLPFPENCISKIYSSHLFEHLSFKESQIFLGSCLRALKPTGYFSICVPNAKIYLEAYLGENSLDKKYFGYKPAFNNTTKIDYVNYTAYMNGEHKYMFDEENLVYILKLAGFNNVKIREFDPMCDLKERDFESIYAEAMK